MKKNIILIYFNLLLFCNITFAQNNFNQPTVTVGNTTFICEGSTEYQSVRVRNANNVLYSQASNIPYSEHNEAVKIDFYPQLYAIVRNTLSSQKIQELSTDQIKGISITYYVQQGKVKELRFLVPKSTKLTPTELASLESAIKMGLTFNYTDSKYQSANFIVNTFLLRFDKL